MQLVLNGNDPMAVHLPFDKGTPSSKLVAWLSRVYIIVNSESALRAKVKHCWERTGLLSAWDVDTQREAVEEAARIFKDVKGAGVECEAPADESKSSQDPGAPFDAEPGELNGQQQAIQQYPRWKQQLRLPMPLLPAPLLPAPLLPAPLLPLLPLPLLLLPPSRDWWRGPT